MALAAMHPRDDVSRTSAASLHSRSSALPATTATSAQTPRLPSLAHLYQPAAAGSASARPLQPPLPTLGRAPPTPLSPAPSLHRSLPTLPATSRNTLRQSTPVIGDPLLPSLAPSYSATASYLPPPTGIAAQAGPSRRLSVPLPLRGEKRKTDLVPPPGSNIKDYCAVLTPFIYKLYCLVSDEATNDLCCWSDDGLAFLVRDPTAFAASVLPNYFKHNQFSSFVRQLNKYRFHKLAPGAFLFGHDRFVRGRPDLLREIGRQRSPDRAPVQQQTGTNLTAGGGASTITPASPASKRARIRTSSASEDVVVEVEAIRGAVAVETAPLRGDVAALRRENAQLNARVQQLEDIVAALRQHVDYLERLIQSQVQSSAAGAGGGRYTATQPISNLPHAQRFTSYRRPPGLQQPQQAQAQRRSLPLPPHRYEQDDNNLGGTSRPPPPTDR